MQAKVKAGTSQPLVVTANRLLDGRVVWLADGETWTEQPRAARVFVGAEAEAGLAAGAAAEQRQEVVGAYAVVVTRTPDGPWPVGMREQIRAAGPSIQAGIAA
jgi:Protein of unknown function (DUF2849)